MFLIKNLFKKVWEGYTKAPPQPGADCEGKRHTVHTLFYYKASSNIKKFLSMLGTAAEGEEDQLGDGPQLLYIQDLKRVNISVKAMVGR